MNPIVVALLVVAFTFGGALFGMWLRRILPAHHLSDDSRDVIRVSIGLIVTMTALILGMVVSSAKEAFDDEDSAVKQSAADILTLDQDLALYGSETGDIRRLLRQSVVQRMARIWPELGDGAVVDLTPAPGLSDPLDRILAQTLALAPTTDAQRWLQTRALELITGVQARRWLVIERQESHAGQPFIIALTCWLILIFVSFGLFSPRHATGIGTLLFCSASVAAATFLILELDHPYQGIIKVSPEPWQLALTRLDK